MKHKTRTKALSVLLCLALLLGLMPGMSLSAYAGSDSGTAENPWKIGKDNAENVTAYIENDTLIISGTGAMADYMSDDYVPWYSSGSSITNVVIESGVTSIGVHAFGFCSQLTNVDIPSSVTSIGNYAFYPSCSHLTSVTIPNGVTSIGIQAFAGSALTSVTIPSSVTSIDSAAFMMCQALANVTFTPGTAGAELTIGNNAFKWTADNATVSFGTGNTKLYDGDTDITSTTKLTDISNKTLTWKANHTHNFTYSLNDANDTITATCTTDDCPLDDGTDQHNHTAKLTIAAPPHTLVFDENDANAVITDAGNIKGNAVVSYYATDTNGNKTGEALTEAPTAEGKYWAEITLGEGDVAKTAHVVYDITNPEYNITFPTNLENGTVTAKIGDTVVTKAHYGDTVTLVATPNDGYALNYIQYKRSDGLMTELTGTDNICTFTMPKYNINIVAVKFREKSHAGAAVTTTGDGGKASLMKNDYSELKSTDQFTEGDTFILCVNKNEDYDFNVSGASMTEFTEDEYKAYLAYAEENNISVPLNTVMAWVTMPYVNGDNLNLNVNFQKQQTYTILYQPKEGENPDLVACKIVRTVNSTEETSYTALQRGATMGNGTAVWSMKMTAAYEPNQIAFYAANASTIDETITFETAFQDKTMEDGAASQSTDNWKDITGGGKYLVIGGEAKVVTAAFIADPNTMKTFKDNAVDEPETTSSTIYRLAVVTDGSAGTVTAPAAATAPTGKTFVGWRGFQYDANGKASEKIYAANATDVPVRDNATFTAVWKPAELNVTLNLNGGTGGSSVDSVTYGEKLTIAENPTRKGYSFEGWTVGKTVTENGVSFAKGSPFDLNTPITADLELTAQWKHVHSYSCYQISAFGNKLAKYQKYEKSVHVAVCDCNKIELMAHEFDSNGKCACGYQKPGAATVTLNISYGQWINNDFNLKMEGMPETAKQGEEVSVCAPTTWGGLEFSKWQYSAGDGQWLDLTSCNYAAFIIPANMYVRALYINPVTQPQVELSARQYDDQAEVDGQTYTMDNILFNLNYKLPDNYTFVDAGIRLGDNNGISYYFIQQVRYSFDNECKGILAGIATGVTALGALTGNGDHLSLMYDVGTGIFEKGYSVNYLETEGNVLEKENMDAATLAQYMYESKPVNVPKYDPIYWETKAVTKGMSGSMNTIPPLRFAQKYGGRNYIYGIGYLRYKDKNGIAHTIYTEALPAAVKYMPDYTVSKTGN